MTAEGTGLEPVRACAQRFSRADAIQLTRFNSHPHGHFTAFTPTDARSLVSTLSEPDPRYAPRRNWGASGLPTSTTVGMRVRRCRSNDGNRCNAPQHAVLLTRGCVTEAARKRSHLTHPCRHPT